VAACQVALDIDDTSGTQQRLENAVRQAVSQGAELVVLPELASSGYCFRPRRRLEERRSLWTADSSHG
jgi:5-aminopentanamidase